MTASFATPFPLLAHHRSNYVTKTARRRRAVPQCALKKMLVVDLQELLRQAANDASEVRDFSERVQVDRASSKDQTFVLFCSSSGYDATIRSINDAQLIEPDALTTLSGTELYQRGYRTPDPYWGQRVLSRWTPKPVQWVASKFFSDEVKDTLAEEDFSIKVILKGSGPSADFCKRMADKLQDMGISARVILSNDSKSVLVVPAAGSLSDVVSFCQGMLEIPENATFVFGSDDLINACVQGKGNIGLCPAGTNQQWEAFDGRVYISKEYGVKALLDGVMHHAVF